jgi:hypothetical protein
MNDHAKPVSRPWRRLLRFRVRRVIVLVLVVGVGTGWVVRAIRDTRIQRQTIAAITKAGGVALYNWEWSDGKAIGAGKPRAPKWLVDLVGVDYFGHVTSLSLLAMETDLPMAA